MNGKTARRSGMAFLVVLACVGLIGCDSSPPSTSLAPTAIAVKRYGVDGGLDTAGFGGGSGAVATKIDPSEFEYALAVALQSGKIIAAGHSVLGGRGVIALVRYNTDGLLDTTFGSSGIVRTAVLSVNAVATAVVVQPGALPADDKILVAGSTFDPSTEMTGIVLARYNTDGSLDASFGGQGFVSAEIGPGTSADTVSLALQGIGSVVVAGATSDGDFVLQRYDSNGVLDSTFGTDGTGGTTRSSVGASATSPAIALQLDGKIVAAGGSRSFASSPRNSVLVRYNTNGSLDTTFGGVSPGIVFTDIASSDNFSNAVVVQPVDDKIVVAGHALVDFTADTSDIALIRYDANGVLDPSFGGGTGVVVTDLGAFDNALSVALQPTGEILVSGNTGSGGITRVALLRYTAGGVLDSSNFGTNGVVITSATGPSSIASGNAVAFQPGVGIVVAGYD